MEKSARGRLIGMVLNIFAIAAIVTAIGVAVAPPETETSVYFWVFFSVVFLFGSACFSLYIILRMIAALEDSIEKRRRKSKESRD